MMKCRPTSIPSAGEVDVEALKEKYRQERDKRLRPEGQKQYVRPVGDFAEEYEGDPHMPVAPRAPLFDEIDVAVLGGGFSGILASVHLRQAGLTNFRTLDHAGDFGGVWYWNRYPGIQCDNDAYCYLPLLEEMNFMPSRKFADGAEIFAYAQLIAKRFDLYKNALFHTLVEGLRWDESGKRWRITTNRGDDIRARFVIMANGLLNIPKLPGIPGIHEFNGKMFHTARWEYEYTGGSHENPVLDKLADKRVAIVGTGATAIQAVPHLARCARQLYVLQRTPSSVDDRPNPPTNPDWVKSLEPGWKKERQANFHRFAIQGPIPGETDLICDFWTEINRNLDAEFEREGRRALTIEEYMKRREIMDYRVVERLRRRIETVVVDQEAAAALKPWYRFFCKRPLSNNDYYPAFNRPNVKLIDVSATRGVERMTPRGFIARGLEYEIDCMIFASGFEVTSDLDRRWGIDVIEGRNGLSLYKCWADDCKTLHGMMSRGFPNLFFVGFYQGGFNATTTETFNRQGQHIAYIVKQALTRGATTVEPGKDAQDAWVKHIRATAFDVSELQRECTPSYFNNEGEKQVGNGKEQYRWYLGEAYGPGWDAFEKLMQDWRDKGDMQGLDLTSGL
jgi:cation diffusion facilitator CzcD-associated flavoprotein CzcO